LAIKVGWRGTYIPNVFWLPLKTDQILDTDDGHFEVELVLSQLSSDSPLKMFFCRLIDVGAGFRLSQRRAEEKKNTIVGECDAQPN